MTATDGATPRYIYKIETSAAWQAAKAARTYAGSADDARDGFIHFSTATQVPGTFDKYFAARPALILAQVDTTQLGAALKWEASRGGALFPHLYGKLDMSAVTWSRPIATGADGHTNFPAEMT